MDFSEFKGFLTCRASVREYDGTPLTEDEVSFILSCAGTAPSAGNLESWDVIVVTDEDVREALSEAAYGQEHISQAPAVFVVCANYVRSMSRYGERGILYAIEDASIACTYMMLAAHSKNISTCWTGAFEEEEVREVLSLPSHIKPVSLLAAGHGHTPPVLTGRMPVGEHVHRDLW